ncbi:ABC transporter ATP-binding protein [Jiangella sp. DSM 45060]|uniref:ABC transporter ATP-binding protein n=1 Tax=Jiangella sp. DSM 45060 TaxID=1798224 RepID=UPI00087C438F|nr:ABC transporter ATP-binding protein [Jiangella sp. DSM 45060]SDT46389.1 carbohydrate ABC transporter ATP-binding protein, CUT1 family [Jiangella sp. DSM 45060]
MADTTTEIRQRAAGIRLRGLTKKYGDVTAVQGLDLAIDAGQFVTFLGPSGCGKSTSLHMIAGLETATSGTITIGDRDVTAVPPQDRDIAMVFQSYALYPHYTVWDNIAFPLRAKRRKMPKAEVEARVRYASGVLGLDELLDRYPRELSGGQRQRVALGRATVRQPAAFLLDEPLSNLDLQLRLDTRSELKDLHERLSATMVYVTHDQAEAMVLSDTIVVLRSGVVQQVGTPLDCYNNPANTFVARFIGEPGMNLLDGRHRGRDGAATFGVRPENLTLAQPGQPGITGTVKAVELLGSRALLRVVVGETTVVASVPPLVEAKPGDEVRLAVVDPSSVRLFDPETGLAQSRPDQREEAAVGMLYQVT